MTTTNNLIVVSHDNATFSCTATAKPLAIIQWSRNGMALTGTMDKFIITNFTQGECFSTNPTSECMITSVLTIVDSVPNDSGEYLCTAINFAGNDTAFVSLTVHGKLCT